MIHLLTMQHFLNSLLLETSCVNIIAQRLTLTLNDGRKLDIPLNYVSPSGRHRYTGQVLLNDATLVQAISFEHAIPLLLDTCFSGISEQKNHSFFNVYLILMIIYTARVMHLFSVLKVSSLAVVLSL